MSEEIKTITQDEINEKGVCSAPTVLTGTPEENKKIFDRLCSEVVIPRLNSVIDALKKNSEDIGSASVYVEENKRLIENLISSLGDIGQLGIEGDDLYNKLENLKNSFLKSITDLYYTIGNTENLHFVASSVVNALNYIYDSVSPGIINYAGVLPSPSADNLMKIFRTFDVDDYTHKLYICKVKFNHDFDFSIGDICKTLYFDPDATEERYASFRCAYLDKFSPVVNRSQYINIMSFVNPDDENDKLYLQIKYSTVLQSFVLSCCKEDGSYTKIWASKNFKMDGISHTMGYSEEAQSSLFEGYKITDIADGIRWLVGNNEFQPHYYWEVVGNISNVTVTKNGKYSTLTVKQGEDATSVVIEDGANGYTPIKGQDYFTQSDIDEIATAVEEELKDDILSAVSTSPTFVNSIDECVDTSKIYLLPDGFLYAYMEKHIVNIPNMFDLENGAKLNYRVNTSGSEVYENGIALTGYIDIELADPYLVKIKNITLTDVYGGAFNAIVYDSSDKRIGARNIYASSVEKVNGEYVVDLYDLLATDFPNAKRVRIGLGIRKEELSETDADISSLFIEFVPKNTDEYVSSFSNTGHAFIPTDYEEEINNIRQKNDALSEEVYLLRKKLDSVSGGLGTYPSVWEGEIERVVGNIEDARRSCGIDCVTFAFFSDNHQRLGCAGELIWEVMNRCDIPYVFFGGDSISNGTISSAEAMEEEEKKFKNTVSCIKDGRFCRAVGNHDGYYLLPTGEKYHYTWEETYRLFMASIAVSQNKQFGGDGTYYYVDDISSKTRFIVLNSVWFNYKTNDDGTVNKSDGVGFGGEQIKWLSKVLLNTAEDWSVVFVSHSPITNNYHSNIKDSSVMQGLIKAFAEGETYSCKYSDSLTDNTDVSVYAPFSKKGTVIGWFSGHIHRDLISTEDANTGVSLPFKTVTITSDANMSYDVNEPERDMSGDTSHAIDFITVNKKTGDVFISRLGIGEDRWYNYKE